MTTIGIIGSGNVGSNLARAAIAHGYDAVLSNSQGPDSLAGLVAELTANLAKANRPASIRQLSSRPPMSTASKPNSS